MARPPRTAVFHSQVVLDCSVDARMSAFISGVKLGTQREGVICFAEINAPKPGSSSFLPRSIISLRKIETHLLGPGLSRLCRTRSFLLIIPNCSEAKDRLGRVKWVSQEPDQIFGSRACWRKCAQEARCSLSRSNTLFRMDSLRAGAVLILGFVYGQDHI